MKRQKKIYKQIIVRLDCRKKHDMKKGRKKDNDIEKEERNKRDLTLKKNQEEN